jgi:hypothetical protein
MMEMLTSTFLKNNRRVAGLFSPLDTSLLCYRSGLSDVQPPPMQTGRTVG